MKLSEVLGRVDGLNKRFVYYLEAQGYISPTKIKKERISRRDYSERDLTIVSQTWSYYRRGYSVASAFEMSKRLDEMAAYVLLEVPSQIWKRTFELLRAIPTVHEVAFVYGQSADAVVRVAAPDEPEIYSVLNQVFDQAAIAGMPRIYRVDRGFRRETERVRGEELQAYLLIKVPAKHAGGVLEELRGYPGVVEASVIYGETDIIARVSVDGQDELDELVIEKIQGLPVVESTRTFLVVRKLHWSRESERREKESADRPSTA